MTTAQKLLLTVIPLAYLVGSVPFGLLVGLTRGIDVRKAGSGNIGATNVGRLLGGRFFALTFSLDLLKGLLPMLAAGAVLRFAAEQWLDYLLWLLVGFAAILGHMFSIFLGLKGGKGVATSTGVVVGLWPFYTLPCLVAVAVWLVAFKISKIVSISSMLGAAMFPVAYIGIGLIRGWDVFGSQWPLLAFSMLVAVMILLKHRSNVARLRAGTEHRFGQHVGGNGDTTGHADGNGNGETPIRRTR
jgi:glycerol-3-phosphate acyltransferase PlsY